MISVRKTTLSIKVMPLRTTKPRKREYIEGKDDVSKVMPLRASEPRKRQCIGGNDDIDEEDDTEH